MQDERLEDLKEVGAEESEITETAEISDTDTAEEPTESISPEESPVDYSELEASDMAELCSLFPSLRGKTSITQLDNPIRYAALRDLGLSPKEAYLATSEPIRREDNRSHLTAAITHSAGNMRSSMTSRELDAARELFSGLSDREIRKLYNKVTK